MSPLNCSRTLQRHSRTSKQYGRPYVPATIWKSWEDSLGASTTHPTYATSHTYLIGKVTTLEAVENSELASTSTSKASSNYSKSGKKGKRVPLHMLIMPSQRGACAVFALVSIWSWFVLTSTQGLSKGGNNWWDKKTWVSTVRVAIW